MTLSTAIRTGRLDEFVAQEERRGIGPAERALNEILYELYALTPDERNLVENEPGRRNAALAAG